MRFNNLFLNKKNNNNNDNLGCGTVRVELKLRFTGYRLRFTVSGYGLKTPVELPYISCKNLSDFTFKILEDNALFLQVSWKILEDNVWSCKILQENVWSCKILQENI